MMKSSTRESFTNPNQFDLVRQKGVYPYDYMDSFNRFSETQLPPKNGFVNRLNGAHIGASQDEHAQRVWIEFRCDTLMDYHDVYLKSDVLLLADFFEKFRCVCLSDYTLDPLHHYTSPGLAWDAALKTSRFNLELITDIDMYNFIEQSIRSGISIISNRYAANLPNVVKELRTHLIYLDATNLYGWAMNQYLPTHGFIPHPPQKKKIDRG